MKIRQAYLRLSLSIAGMPLAVWAQEAPYERWGMHNMWGPWGIGMMLMMAVFWGLIIVALVLGVRWLTNQGSGPRTDSALDILRQRYARGEINKEEFETKKRELS
jgi:putative membrane protein